jgi:hypothetical protein
MNFKGAFTILSFASLLLATIPLNRAQSQTPGYWCNQPFRFCVKYPASLLPSEENILNNDGVILKSFDGYTSVTASGHAINEPLSTRALYDQIVAKITESNQKPSFVSNIFGDDFFEAFFIWGDDSYFLRNYLFRNYYILVVMKSRVNKPELISRLREDIDIQLNIRQLKENH